jgi:hypothetical protein
MIMIVLDIMINIFFFISLGGGFTVTVEIAQGQTAQGQAQEGSQVILRCRSSEQASNYRWTFTSVSYSFYFLKLVYQAAFF